MNFKAHATIIGKGIRGILRNAVSYICWRTCWADSYRFSDFSVSLLSEVFSIDLHPKILDDLSPEI